MSEVELMFSGLARDCETGVLSLAVFLRKLKAAGISAFAVVGENGSKDATRRVLEDAQAEGLLSVVDTRELASYSGRLRKMAVGRSLLQREIAERAEVVCVLDLDEPFLDLLTPELVKEKCAQILKDDFFARAATSRPYYYDLLAYEDSVRSYLDLEANFDALRRHPVAYYRYFRDFVYVEQRFLTTDKNIVCRSAFNGLCFYAGHLYSQGRYLSSRPEEQICEHVVFNRSLAGLSGKSMLIDSDLVVPMPSEHGPRGVVAFVYQRLSALVHSRAA